MKTGEQQANKLPALSNGLPVAEILEAVKAIRYGHVHITIQDSKVVQIDKTEKTRLKA